MKGKLPRFVAAADSEGGKAGVVRGAGNPVGRPGIAAAAAKGKKKGKKAKKKGPVARY